MGLCRGLLDSIVEVRVGDRAIYDARVEGAIIQWLGNEEVTIDKPDLFGGDEGEGGVVGNLKVMFGAPNQEAPSTLVAMLGEELPGYRGITTAFFDGQISAMNPYPKPWSWRVRGIGDPLNTDTMPISVGFLIETGGGRLDPDAICGGNPAFMIYCALVNRTWGRGLPAYMLDIDSFHAVSATLVSEVFGLNMSWKRRDGIDAFIQNVLDHIGGTLFTDRSTGLLKLKLLRGDYVADDLPLFSQELGVFEITEATTVAAGPLINEVKVLYVDPITGEDRTVVVRNPAALQTQGQGINSLTKEYRGLGTPELALKVAQRDLKAQGAHLRRFVIKMNRIGWRVEPGMCIRIQDLARGIYPTVVRIGAIEDGPLGNGAVTIKAIQDVFSLPAATFAGSEPPKWEPPNNTPCIGVHRVIEMPYFLLARTMDRSEFEILPDEAGFIATMCEKGQPLNIAYDIATRPDAPTLDDEADEGYFCDGYTPP